MRRNVEEIKLEKQAQIFEGALATIKEKGFHGARMSDIARRAGVSYGLVYHYYKTKEELFEAILNDWWGYVFQLLDGLEEKDINAKQKLYYVTRYLLKGYQEKPLIVHVFITEISRSTTNLSRNHRLDYFKSFIAQIKQIIQAGQAEGFFRKDIKAHYLSNIFVGAVEGFLSILVMNNQKLKDKEQTEIVTRSIMEVFFNGASFIQN